jgi:hypothetical protein
MPEPQVENGHVPGDCGRLRLRFEGRSAAATLQDLPVALERWNSILSHFSRVTPGTAPRALLLEIQGQPLAFEVAAPTAVLAPMQTGLRSLREVLVEVVALADKVDELRRLNVRPEILQSLDEQVRDNRQVATARIADDIRTRYACDQDARNAVHKALIALATFVEEGGCVEIAPDAQGAVVAG